jgi:hypothetical protein
MQEQGNRVGSVCAECGARRLVDEHSRCERCVRDATKRSAELHSFEESAAATLEAGVTPDQLREAVELFLTDSPGRVAGVERDHEGWAMVDSAFCDETASVNRLRRARVMAGWTLEELADRLDVDPARVAVWEGGGDIPARAVEVYTELTGSSADFLLGKED